MLKTLLQSASFALANGDNALALNYLSGAREIARAGDTVSMKAVAVHCTAAMQAIFPDMLEDTILSPSFDDLFRPVRHD